MGLSYTAKRQAVGHLIRTWNRIVPLSPGMSLPSIAHLSTAEPASLFWTVNVAGRDVFDVPSTYSSRAVRLSANVTSVMISVVGLVNLRDQVTTAPICSGFGGSIRFSRSRAQPLNELISSGPRT